MMVTMSEKSKHESPKFDPRDASPWGWIGYSKPIAIYAIKFAEENQKKGTKKK